MDKHSLEKTEKSTGILNEDSINIIADDFEQKEMEQSSTDLFNEVNEDIMKNEMNMF